MLTQDAKKLKEAVEQPEKVAEKVVTVTTFDETMTVKNLHEFAGTKGIDIPSDLRKKADVVEFLKTELAK